MTFPKTLCITNDFGPRAGGIETFVIGLIERMPHGTVVVYTSSQSGSDTWDQMWFEKFGVTVIRDKSSILLPSLRVGRAVRKAVRDYSIESVFFGAAAPLGLLAHGLKRVGVSKIVALTHGHEVWWAKVFPFSIAIRRIGNGVDILTYLGSFTQRAISRSLSQRAQSSMVRIAPGIDTSHFQPQLEIDDLKAELNLREKKVIVSVGRLVHRKGQDKLIEAMPQIITREPNAHLLLVGIGPYEDYLRELVHSLDLHDYVTFVGRVQYADLPKYISLGNIFAMPSRSRLAGLEVEGLGIVYLEASACGLPVVGGVSGGAPDALIEGVTGHAVNGLNHLEIAATIVALLADPEKAAAMGRAGRAWIIEQWEWQHWSKQFNELLTP